MASNGFGLLVPEGQLFEKNLFFFVPLQKIEQQIPTKRI